MIEDRNYVDYNKRPLKLLGFQFVRLEVAVVTVSKARVLVAPNSCKSIVGRDWLIALRYQIKQPKESDECERTTQAVNCDQSVKKIKCKQTTQAANCNRSVNSVKPKKRYVPGFSNLVSNFRSCLKEKAV